VSRNTVRFWLKRSSEVPLEELSEHSRRPLRIWRTTEEEVELRILELKARRPAWGAKKLVASLWPEDPPLCVRTADRILKRHGLVKPRNGSEPVQRFERERPNELWQMDFKGLGGPSLGYSPFSTLDDMSRYCLGLRPLPDHRSISIFEALWDLCGEFGLPEAILSDNESCFADVTRRGPSWLESQLWLLGIRTLHGRPYHPQTQGKIERFHRTLEDEYADKLRHRDIAVAERAYKGCLYEYNFERPHESLGMKKPAQVYTPSARKRPAKLPEHQIPEGTASRKVDAAGKFSFGGVAYRTSSGLAGQRVVIQEAEEGLSVLFAGRKFARLEDLKL
jgi:putative transposase